MGCHRTGKTGLHFVNLTPKPGEIDQQHHVFGFTPLVLLMYLYQNTRKSELCRLHGNADGSKPPSPWRFIFSTNTCKRKETASAIAIIVVCGLLLLSDQSALQSQTPGSLICVSGADLANLNLKDFRLAGARAEKTIF